MFRRSVHVRRQHLPHKHTERLYLHVCFHRKTAVEFPLKWTKTRQRRANPVYYYFSNDDMCSLVEQWAWAWACNGQKIAEGELSQEKKKNKSKIFHLNKWLTLLQPTAILSEWSWLCLPARTHNAMTNIGCHMGSALYNIVSMVNSLIVQTALVSFVFAWG